MSFGPGNDTRFGSRNGKSSRTSSRRSSSTKTWNQAHLVLVTEAMNLRSSSQRLSPDLVYGERPKLQILEGCLADASDAFGNGVCKTIDGTVDVEIRYQPESRTFSVTLEQGGVEIENRFGRRSQHVSLTLGFESIDGKKVRIPWAQIERGLVWRKVVGMRESFFEDLRQKRRLNYLLNSNAERLAPR